MCTKPATNGVFIHYKRYNGNMENESPVSSSNCRRGCCWTPYGTCGQARKCHCHVPTYAEVMAEHRAAAHRKLEYMLQLTRDMEDAD